MSFAISTTTISAEDFIVTLAQHVPHTRFDQVPEIAMRALHNLQKVADKVAGHAPLQFFDLVFIANFGLLPSQQASFHSQLQEEAKLYVGGCTRLQEETSFVVPDCRDAIARTIQQTKRLKQSLPPKGQAEWPKTPEEGNAKYCAACISRGLYIPWLRRQAMSQ